MQNNPTQIQNMQKKYICVNKNIYWHEHNYNHWQIRTHVFRFRTPVKMFIIQLHFEQWYIYIYIVFLEYYFPNISSETLMLMQVRSSTENVKPRLLNGNIQDWLLKSVVNFFHTKYWFMIHLRENNFRTEWFNTNLGVSHDFIQTLRTVYLWEKG